MVSDLPEETSPSAEELRLAYHVATGSRILEEHIVRLAARGDVKFAIWGPGEEVHGTATSLAWSHVIDDVSRFGLVPHYRSGSLVSMWAALNGWEGFTQAVLRQQFSKDTDRMGRGRQMVNHLDIPELGILPVQSPVGMQLGKAAGWALGLKRQGIARGMAAAIIGDGTTAEGDLHDAMNAASVWDLPLVIMVTDNGVAISTPAGDGRGIRDFEAYAAAFDVAHFTCDGRDFWDCYRAAHAAGVHARDHSRPALLHVRDLPRFNGHSSAADMTFDLSQDDPLIAFGEELVRRGALEPADVMRRIEGKGRDFFHHHDLGRIGARHDESVKALMAAVRAEPDPPLESVLEHVRPPFPEVVESIPAPGTTNVSYAAAIRSALDHTIAECGGLLVGQDVGDLGGVMQATAGLKKRHPDHVIDAPLNEPLICGTAMGAGLHREVRALPEIQFGDYSLNAFHWLVHMGNLHWCSAGNSSTRVVLRMPVDPFGGGAVYHSMSLEGYFSAIPGLVLLMPSTSWDIYGLLMTASEYDGPVVCLEPKWLYRQSLGPAFPGEPTDRAEIAAMKRGVMRGEIPDLPRDLRVPFGKGVIRRSGSDVTIVSWGRMVWTALAAAEGLAAEGASCEVIDLRTLVPPDLELVYESVARTGRLVVAAEDRAFAGFVRSIQGHVVERYPGLPTRAIGQLDVPGIAQNLALEHHTVLEKEGVAEAVREVLGVETRGARVQGWSWVPPRYFIS